MKNKKNQKIFYFFIPIFFGLVFGVASKASADEVQTPLYASPYIIYLTNGATNAAPIIVSDKNGNQVSGTLSFSGYNSSLISISSSGYVTARRSETISEIGTNISVSITVSGQVYKVENSVLVRVLGHSLAYYNTSLSDYKMVWTDHVGIYYPTVINGENIEDNFNQFEVSQVFEYGYEIQSQLLNILPYNGAKHIIVVDFGEAQDGNDYKVGQLGACVCGLSGDPLRLGWLISGDAMHNCFMVPFGGQPRSPQTGIMFHEMSHSFLTAGVPHTTIEYKFLNSMGVYSETLTSYLALQTMYTLIHNQSTYPLDPIVVTRLTDRYNDSIGGENGSEKIFNNWVSSGADFSQLSVDIVHGLLLSKRNNGPADFVERFYKLLQPDYSNQIAAVTPNFPTNNQWHTFFAAMVSAAMGEDLYDEFQDSYHFPVDQNTTTYYNLYNEFRNILDGVPIPNASTAPITAVAAISGIAQVGYSLTVGTLAPAGATATYQWQRATISGGAYSNIANATSNKYLLTSSDLGKYIKVVATGSGNYTGTVTSVATALVTTPITAVAPTSSPDAGTYNSNQSVTLSTATTGAVIYYTTDGTTPTISSTLYIGAISISKNTTLKAIAVKSGSINSEVMTASFTISAPSASPIAVASSSVSNITKTSATVFLTAKDDSTCNVVFGTKVKTTTKKFKVGKKTVKIKTTSISGARTVFDTNHNVYHSLNLKGLKKNKTYYYQITTQNGTDTSKTAIMKFKTAKK